MRPAPWPSWRRSREPLLAYAQAAEALGVDHHVSLRVDDVPLRSVAGSLARHHEFDREFRPRTRRARHRVRAHVRGAGPSTASTPVRLLQLGELYFVADGHHRIALAQRRGQPAVEAQVARMCTVAFGLACLRAAHGADPDDRTLRPDLARAWWDLEVAPRGLAGQATGRQIIDPYAETLADPDVA